MSPSESNFRRAPLKTAQTDVSSQTIRTIPELIDFHARQNPDHVFCMQSDSSLEGEEFHTVDYACLENAILACQTSILGDIGPACLPRQNADGSIVKSAPVALLMESDLSILLYLFSLFGLGIPVCIRSK
jgi:acyl-CoA synthetase (AMP-forming)/AMP-acid ligase II